MSASGSSHNPVRKIRHLIPRDKAHHLNNGRINWDFRKHLFGVAEYFESVLQGRGGNTGLLRKVDDFSKADRRSAYVIPAGDRLSKSVSGWLRKPGGVKQVSDCGVRVGDRDDHAMPSRPKFANISARFSSISSADGAGPR